MIPHCEMPTNVLRSRFLLRPDIADTRVSNLASFRWQRAAEYVELAVAAAAAGEACAALAKLQGARDEAASHELVSLMKRVDTAERDATNANAKAAAAVKRAEAETQRADEGVKAAADANDRAAAAQKIANTETARAEKLVAAEVDRASGAASRADQATATATEERDKATAAIHRATTTEEACAAANERTMEAEVWPWAYSYRCLRASACSLTTCVPASPSPCSPNTGARGDAKVGTTPAHKVGTLKWTGLTQVREAAADKRAIAVFEQLQADHRNEKLMNCV